MPNTAGQPPTRAQLDSAIGNVLRNLHMAMKDAVQLKETIESINVADGLQDEPYNYTVDEAYLVGLAFQKVAELETTYSGGALPGGVYDYETLTLPLRGISY